MRWEAAYGSKIKALEGVGTGATPRGSQGWLESTLRLVAITAKRTVRGKGSQPIPQQSAANDVAALHS
jgi:nucleoid-associated protein YgaU